MANKDKSQATEVKEQDVKYAPEGKEKDVKQGEVINVSATASTMPINGANAATGNRPTEAEMKREVDYAKKVLETQATKSVSIPKQMAQYVGETMISCINGACIRVPVDGESYDVPGPYAELITNSLKTIHAGDVRSAHGFGDKVDHDALKR